MKAKAKKYVVTFEYNDAGSNRNCCAILEIGALNTIILGSGEDDYEQFEDYRRVSLRESGVSGTALNRQVLSLRKSLKVSMDRGRHAYTVCRCTTHQDQPWTAELLRTAGFEVIGKFTSRSTGSHITAWELHYGKLKRVCV